MLMEIYVWNAAGCKCAQKRKAFFVKFMHT